MKAHAARVLKEAAGYSFSIREDSFVDLAYAPGSIQSGAGASSLKLPIAFAQDDDIYIESAELLLAAAQSGADTATDDWELDVQNAGKDGTGTASLISGAKWTSQAALAALTPTSLVVDQNQVVPRREQVVLVITETNGGAGPAGSLMGRVHVVYRRRV